MKVAVIGSRNIVVSDLSPYLPQKTTQILSGGARGVDLCARAYAQKNGIRLCEYLPDYARHKRGAPLVRNRTIVDEADLVLAFWDGSSRGTKYVIEYAAKTATPCRVFLWQEETRDFVLASV